MPRQSPADGVWRLEARRSDLIFSRLRRVKSGPLLRALQRQPSLSQANPPASRWESLSLHHNPFSSSGDLSIVSKAPHSCLGGTRVSGRVHSAKCPSARNSQTTLTLY